MSKGEVVQRLCIPAWVTALFGKWVDSGSIDLSKVIPLECYTKGLETVRKVTK